MKRITIKARAMILLTVLTTVSCQDHLDINTDPNNPPVEQGTPALVFPAAVTSTVGRIGAEYAIVGGIWAQFWTQSAFANQYRTIDSYNVTQADFNASFDETFSGALNDYQFVIRQSEESEDWSFFLMATVMKAYTYQVMVDLYDMLPYDEAFQGAENLQPHFEDGYTIYTKLLAEIDAALAKDLNATTVSEPGASDLIFDGEMDQWVRFANTLKLKLYIRMAYTKPAEAEAGIRALYDQGALFLETDAALDKFEDQPNKSNPLYEFNFRQLNVATNLRASVTMLSFLEENGDPRADAYYTKTGGEFLGMHQGDYNNDDEALEDASVAIVNATDPVHFISLAESYFLQAEALERYFAGAGAKDMYDAGVTAAFDQHGLADQAADFIGAGDPYAYPSSGTFEEKLEAIIVQKWASLPGAHALEAFFEKNRTGYPQSSPVYSTNAAYVPGQIVRPITSVLSPGEYPKRLIFPESERRTNPNTPELQELTEEVWWDVN